MDMEKQVPAIQDWGVDRQGHAFDGAWAQDQQVDLGAIHFTTAKEFRARMDLIEPAVLGLCCTLVGSCFTDSNLHSKLAEIRDRWSRPEPIKLQRDLGFLRDWLRSIPAPQEALRMWLIADLSNMAVVQEYAYLSERWKQQEAATAHKAKKSKQKKPGSSDMAVQSGLQSLLSEMTGLWLELEQRHAHTLFAGNTTTNNATPILEKLKAPAQQPGPTDIPAPNVAQPGQLLGPTDNPSPELATDPTPTQQQICYTWREAVDKANERHIAARQQNLKSRPSPQPSPFRTALSSSKLLFSFDAHRYLRNDSGTAS